MGINNIRVKLLFVILNLVLLIGCSKHNNYKIEIISVHPFSKEKIKISTFAKDVRYIALETVKGHYLANINKIFYVNNRFYIIDSFNKNSLFCFDNKGKFLFEIGKTGKGPGEFICLTDAEISYDNKSIVVIDQEQHKCIIYDLDGRFVKEQKIPINIYVFNFCLGKDFNMLISQTMLLKEANKIFGSTKQNIITQDYANKHFKLFNYMSSSVNFTETYNGFKTCNLKTDNIVRRKPFDIYHENIYSIYGLNDTIFSLSKNTCIPKFYVDFGANKIPDELAKDERGRGFNELYKNKALKLAGLIDYLVVTDKFIAFSYGTAFQAFNSSIYLTSSKRTINFNQIENDINNGPIGNVVGKYSDDTMITYIESYRFIEEMNNKQNFHKTLNLNYSINDNTNPIIILTTLR